MEQVLKSLKQALGRAAEDAKAADWKQVFFRALTLKGAGSLQGLKVGKVTDLEGAPGYKLVP